MDPRLPSLAALNGRITPSLSSFILSSRLREVMLATHGPSAASRLGVWSIRRPCSETPPLRRPPLLTASAPGWRSRSRRMPGEPLDAPDDLQKESRCQVALGQLEPEGPGVPNEAATGLEQPLLEAREGPALDGERQDQPALQSMTHQCIGVGSMETKRYRLKIATWTVVREPWQPSPRKLDSPEAVVELARDLLRHYDDDKEHFWVILLNAQNHYLMAHLVSTGTQSSTLVHPREVLGPALREGASALILMHNHPSWEATPSREDTRLTRQLVEAAQLMDLRIHDHVIVGNGSHAWVSFASRGLM